MLEGLRKVLEIYSNKGLDIDSVINDIDNNYLTDTLHDEKTVYWYFDGSEEWAINEDGSEIVQDIINSWSASDSDIVTNK